MHFSKEDRAFAIVVADMLILAGLTRGIYLVGATGLAVALRVPFFVDNFFGADYWIAGLGLVVVLGTVFFQVALDLWKAIETVHSAKEKSGERIRDSVLRLFIAVCSINLLETFVKLQFTEHVTWMLLSSIAGLLVFAWVNKSFVGMESRTVFFSEACPKQPQLPGFE